MRVVPETPDREWPTRRTSTAALGVARMAGRRRKRWRIPSSSDEDAARARAIETESGSRDIHSGCAGNTTSTGVAAAGGLFSSAVVSKRRKRNGEQRIEDGGAEVSRKDIRTKKPTKLPGRFLKPLKVDEYMIDAAPSVRDVETEEGGVGKRSGELRFRKRVSNDIVDLCTDSEDDSVYSVAVRRGSRGERSSLPRGVFEFTSDSESESELQSVMASKAVKRSKRTKSNAQNIVRPASPDSDGWFSRRAPPSNQRKSQSKQPPPVNVSDRRGDLTRLKELFPQHEESYLRGKLEECCDVVEEAIANILPSEGSVYYTHYSERHLEYDSYPPPHSPPPSQIPPPFQRDDSGAQGCEVVGSCPMTPSSPAAVRRRRRTCQHSVPTKVCSGLSALPSTVITVYLSYTHSVFSTVVTVLHVYVLLCHVYVYLYNRHALPCLKVS